MNDKHEENDMRLVRDLRQALEESERLRCHHGWRGTGVTGEKVIRTPCPGCGGQLFIGDGGHLTCAIIECSHEPSIEAYWIETQRKLAQSEARVRRVAEAVRDCWRYHACLTGDCPHAKESECLESLLKLDDEIDVDAILADEGGGDG